MNSCVFAKQKNYTKFFIGFTQICFFLAVFLSFFPLQNFANAQSTSLPFIGVYKPPCPNSQSCHNLPYCTGLTSFTALDRIGRDCLIQMPLDCENIVAPDVKKPGLNCIRKTTIYPTNSKYYTPPVCNSSKIHGETCIRADLPYCHEVSTPILTINCRLPSCNAIPNTAIRRPGVNCLADCNAAAGLTSGIAEDGYFYQGFNCLPNCKSTNSPQAGVNCVYDFQGFVSPLCQNISNSSEFLLSNRGGNLTHRRDCVDLIDLPFCSLMNNQQDNVNCVNQCSTNQTSNQNCLAFDGETDYGTATSQKLCHHILSASSGSIDMQTCTRISCDLLTPEELAVVNSHTFLAPTTLCDSSQVACNKFSKEQLVETIIGKNCQPTQCICSTGGDSQDIKSIKNLDSYFLGNLYSSAYNQSCAASFGISQSITYLSAPCCQSATCPPQNAIQIFSCSGTKNNDLCDNPNGNCGPSGTCTKSNIDCRDPLNYIKYSVCQGSVTPETDSQDSFVSWFFRPYPNPKSLQDTTINSITRKELRQMSGCPITGVSCPSDKIYYTVPDMMANGYGRDVIRSLWAHSYGSGDDTRSPGPDGGLQSGLHAIGYDGVCGMKSNPAASPTDDFGYVSGDVESTYTKDGEQHKITLCVRRTNLNVTVSASSPNTCGRRECGISALAGSFTEAVCGHDICKTLTVEGGGDYNKCAMGDEEFDEHNIGSNNSKPCKERLGYGGDNNIKIRAYKPLQDENYICAAMDLYDVDGTNRYDGKELFELEDGKKACVSGVLDQKGECIDSFDTSKRPHETRYWRTIKHFKFIGETDFYTDDASNNYGLKSPGIIGRVDYSTPRFFKKSDCIRHHLRVPPPKQYNVLSIKNSPSAFTPPLYIIRSCKRKGATCEAMPFKDSPTDFYEPMIEVGYGIDADKEPIGPTHRLISIDFNNDNSAANSNGVSNYTSLATALGGIGYNVKVYLKKEFDVNPVVCLYSKIIDENGLPVAGEENDQQIGCIDRTKPEFNNSNSLEFGQPLRKVLMTPAASPAYNNFAMSIRYVYSNNPAFVISSAGEVQTKQISRNSANCSNASCGDESLITLQNDVVQTKSTIGKEEFLFKFERDECTKLNFECVDNQISLNKKVREHSMTVEEANQDSMKIQCQALMESCNKKKGLAISDFNPSVKLGFNQPAKGENYGWFNEICITDGFDDKLKREVVATIDAADDSKFTKCVVDTTLKNPNVDCSAGGKEPDCPCLKSIADQKTQKLRPITAHEAGLCVEIDLPKSCPAISFPPLNPDSSNLYYTSEADLDITYTNSVPRGNPNYNPITSHLSRSNSPFIDENLNSYTTNIHANFEIAMMGEKEVYGTCNGFWKNAESLGVKITPTADCGSDGVWTNFQNPCIRYSCPARETAIYGSDSMGLYPGYDITSIPSQLGQGDGFAIWSKFTKTDDNKQSVDARSCLIGYKPKDSTRIDNNNISRLAAGSFQSYYSSLNSSSSSDSDKEIAAKIRSVYAVITRYKDGTLPSRMCNQLGEWEEVRNQCERIICPSTAGLPKTDAEIQQIIGTTATATGTSLDLWRMVSGIVTNNSAPASRSSLPSINLEESWANGTCLSGLGFVPLSSTAVPRLYCDHNGNWSKAENPCQRNCDAVNSRIGNDVGHGFATWPTFSAIANNDISVSKDSTCIGNRHPYPYPPRLDYEGEEGKAIETATYGGRYNIVNEMTNPQNFISKVEPSSLTYINSSSDSIIKMNVFTGSNDFIDMRINVNGNYYKIKRIDSPVLNGIKSYRNPFIKEFEVGKTYILEKTTTDEGDVYVAYLGYYKNLANDSSYQGGNYAVQKPARTCRLNSNNSGGATSAWTAPDSICVDGCVSGDYDDRIGAGVTQHKHSSGNIFVKWDKESFGSWQLKKFKRVDSSTKFAIEDRQTQTAADYLSGRINGKFAIARYCNPQTHKWDEPTVVCMANKGVISSAHNAKVIADDLQKAAAVDVVNGVAVKTGKTIKGSCTESIGSSPAFEYDFDRNVSGTNVTFTENPLTYSCNADNNGDVDKTYYSSNDIACIQTCESDKNKTFGDTALDKDLGNRYNNNEAYSKKYKSGETVTLQCKPDYGKMKTTASRTIGDSENTSELCGYRAGMSTTRTKDSPTSLCENGIWQDVKNKCDKCVYCKLSEAPNDTVKCSPRCNEAFGIDYLCRTQKPTIRDIVATWKEKNGINEDVVPEGMKASDYFAGRSTVFVFSYHLEISCKDPCRGQTKGTRPKVSLQCNNNGTWSTLSTECPQE